MWVPLHVAFKLIVVIIASTVVHPALNAPNPVASGTEQALSEKRDTEWKPPVGGAVGVLEQLVLIEKPYIPVHPAVQLELEEFIELTAFTKVPVQSVEV